jgi:dTMP kinase
MSGAYVIFEGVDGAGKTTLMRRVAEQYKLLMHCEVLMTRHPGATPLGQHIRQLVKYPQQIDPAIEIDDYSRQMLYILDCIAFVKRILEPNLAKNNVVFADRNSCISSMVYGTADGLRIEELSKLYELFTHPKADVMIVVDLPGEIAHKRTRTTDRSQGDHYDNKQVEFYNRVAAAYKNITNISEAHAALVAKIVEPSNILHVDGTRDLEELTQEVLQFIFAKHECQNSCFCK